MAQVNGFQQPGLRFVSPAGGLKGFQRQGMDQRKKGSNPLAATTLNPADASAGITFSNGNLTAAATASGFRSVRSTVSHNTGQWHFEVTHNALSGVSADFPVVGVADATFAVSGGNPGNDTHAGEYDRDGHFYFNAVPLGAVDAPGVGDIVAVELDADAFKVWVQKLGGTGRKGPFFVGGIGADIFAFVGVDGVGDQVTVNFGGSGFVIAPSPGFSAWNGG